MEDPVANAILNQYFQRLEQALSELPAERRAQIVEDLRTHSKNACWLSRSTQMQQSWRSSIVWEILMRSRVRRWQMKLCRAPMRPLSKALHRRRVQRSTALRGAGG